MDMITSEYPNYMVGIKNNLNDNNCFINVCIQTMFHFKDLTDFLLDNEKKFKIFNNSPKIITNLITLLSSYNMISENPSNNQIVDPSDFRMALAEYFEKKRRISIKYKR